MQALWQRTEAGGGRAEEDYTLAGRVVKIDLGGSDSLAKKVGALIAAALHDHS